MIDPATRADVTAERLNSAGDLFDREHECQVLTRLLSRPRNRGAVVVVAGPPGIGKTRLLSWAQGAARAVGFRVLAARGDELEQGYPFGVALQLLGSHGRWHDAREQRLLGAPAWDQPTFEHVSEDHDEAGPPSFSELHGLYWRFANLTRQQPVVAVVDDAHCADLASLRFLNFLAHRAAELPLILMVGCHLHKPAGIHDDLAALSRHPHSHRVSLAPLSESATAAFIRSRADADVADELCAACHEATAGNPFFLRALVDELVRRDLPTNAGAACEVRTLAPDSVAESLRFRISRLQPGAKALAEATAVLGDGVELRLAERVAGLDHAVAARAAEALTESDVLQRSSRLQFVHPIVRSGIYAGLSAHARNDLHLCAARLLKADHVPTNQVVGHLVSTEPVGEPWVSQALRSAARDAARRSTPDGAATYLDRALREPLMPAERADVLLDLAASEPATSPQMVEHAREALTLAGLPGRDTRARRARAIRLLITGLLMSDRHDEALAVLGGVIEELEHQSDREPRLRFLADLAALANLHPRVGALLGVRIDQLEPELSGGSSVERCLLGILAYRNAQAPGPAEHAVRLAQRALAAVPSFADAEESSATLLPVGIALGLAGCSATAERVLTDLIARARMGGLPAEYAAACAQRGVERFRRGALDEARRDITDALEVMRSRSWHPVSQEGIASLVRIAVEQGALDSAERALREWDLWGVQPETVAGIQLLIARGSLRLAQHRPREALVELDAASHRAATWGKSIMFEWRAPAALTHHMLGDRDRALALAREDLEVTQTWGARRRLGIALCTLGLIEGGDAGITRMHEAVQALEPSTARLEHARALVSLGAMLRRAGQPSDARTFLKAGLEGALQCRAVVLVATADEELAASGVRRRRRTAMSGPQELTPSERRIAAMAAKGLSNPEIAQALFITRKTVEMHLGNVYRKLAIESREQLPDKLDKEADSATRRQASPQSPTALASAQSWDGHASWSLAGVV